jgi:hypothetical protein
MRKTFGSLASAALATVALVLATGDPVAAASTTSTTLQGGFSIGISPTVVNFNNALRGGDYESQITIVNGASVGEWFTVSPAGQIASWARVLPVTGTGTPVTRVFVPNGAEGTTLMLEADVPATAADGAYAGQVNIDLVPPSAAKGKVSAGVGIQLNLTVQVTGTEVVGGSVLEAYTYPKAEVGSAVPVFVRISNRSNITVRPHFVLKVDRSATHNVVYKWAGTTGEGLLPNQVSTFELFWPASSTLTQTLGAYVATLGVTFPKAKNLGAYQLPTRLYPYGFLHRGGKLLRLNLANPPQVGYSAEVNAAVQSTGLIQEETSFIGQLYRNGSFVGEVKSVAPVLLAPAGQAGSSGVITVPVPITKDGLYRLRGVANFAGAQTRPQTLTFRVGAAPVPLAYELAAAAAVVVIALVLVLVLWRRRRPRPPAWRDHVRGQPRYTPTHARTPYVPPRSPVGTSHGGRFSPNHRG